MNKPKFFKFNFPSGDPTGQDAARRGPFRFSMCGISAGAEVVFVDDASKRAVVVDDRHVRFANETTSLSAARHKVAAFSDIAQ